MRDIGSELRGLDRDAPPSLAVLERVLPPAVVEATLAKAGKVAKRRRKLAPPIVTWLVVAMGLLRGLSIDEVLRRIAEDMGARLGWGPAELPCSTAIAHARDRLGWQAVQSLFRWLAESLAKRHSAADTWRGLVVRVIDGTCFMTPDSPGNDAEFGRPATSRGAAKSAFPMLRAVVVFGARTHLVHDAVFGPYAKGELTLALDLLPRIVKGMLLLMDAGFYSYAWLDAVARKGEFIARAKTAKNATKLHRIRGSGSKDDFHAHLRVNRALKKKNPKLPDVLKVRVIRFWAKRRTGELRQITLVTSLLSQENYPAEEIQSLYFERWEGELAFRELKSEQLEERVTFRTTTPNRVRQEAWGMLVAYNCVRALMAEAAEIKGVQPRRIGFVRSLEAIRSSINSFVGRNEPDVHKRIVTLISLKTLPKRRIGRNNPRAVKHKISKYPRKRPGSKTVAETRYRH